MLLRIVNFCKIHQAIILEIFRFGTVGLGSVVVYAVSVILFINYMDFNPAAATVPSYLVSMVFNYVLQKLWTFRSKARLISSLPKYITVHIVGIGINYGIVEIGVNFFSVAFIWAQVVAVAFVAIWSYLAQKYWAFAVKALR